MIFSYAQRRKRTVYYLSVNIWLLPRTTSPCSRSLHITFTVRVTKQHPVNISFQKNQCSALQRHNRVHPCFNSYAPILVHIFYSAIKHRLRCFNLILRRQDRLCLYNALHQFFGKLILTGCCLVTRTVKVIRTDPYINGKIIHSSFPSLCIGKKSLRPFQNTV